MNSRRTLLSLVFAVLTLVQLVPVWSVEYLPTGDGPSHLYGAWLVRTLTSDAAPEPIASYYRVDWRPVPNWASVAFMDVAMPIFTPPTAEKLFFSLILITFLGGAWMYAGADDPDNAAFAFLALPLAYNQLLQAGFYNFSLGVGLYFIAVAVWWRTREQRSKWSIALIAGLLLVCYFAHPMSAALAIGSIAILWILNRSQPIRLVALLPSIALLIWFVAQQPAGRAHVHSTVGYLVHYLTNTQLLYTFDVRQIIFGRIFFALILMIVIATLFLESTSKFAIVLALTVLYFLSPAETSGGAVINERLALFVILAPLPWVSPRLRRLIWIPLVAIFSTIAILNAGFQLRHFRHCDRGTQRFLIPVRQIENNSVVLPLLFNRSMPDAYIGYHVHAIDYVAIEKGLVDLGYYQAGTDYFPIRYKAGIRPPEILEMEGHPDRIDLNAYPEADYVFTWLMPPNARVRSQLEQGFDRVVAANGGELYRRSRAKIQLRQMKSAGASSMP